ncbi:MAG: hypothetical protein ACYDH4_09040 [Candidatus Cryosericum sp.]
MDSTTMTDEEKKDLTKKKLAVVSALGEVLLALAAVAFGIALLIHLL